MMYFKKLCFGNDVNESTNTNESKFESEEDKEMRGNAKKKLLNLALAFFITECLNK